MHCPYRQENVSYRDEIPPSIWQSGKYRKSVFWPFHILLAGGNYCNMGEAVWQFRYNLFAHAFTPQQSHPTKKGSPILHVIVSLEIHEYPLMAYHDLM